MEYLSRWYKSLITVVATTLVLGLGTYGYNQHRIEINNLKSENYFQREQTEKILQKLDTVTIQLKKLEETHPYSGKKWKSRKTGLCTTGNFFGFLLYTPVDTTVSKDLIYTLSTYQGPKAKINSLKRHYNKSSQHYHGKAVDLAWDEEVITFLISEKGKSWLQEHGITLYIEGRPGSARVKKYLSNQEAAEYVFFNPSASGDHIHLNI